MNECMVNKGTSSSPWQKKSQSPSRYKKNLLVEISVFFSLFLAVVTRRS